MGDVPGRTLGALLLDSTRRRARESAPTASPIHRIPSRQRKNRNFASFPGNETALFAVIRIAFPFGDWLAASQFPRRGCRESEAPSKEEQSWPASPSRKLKRYQTVFPLPRCPFGMVHSASSQYRNAEAPHVDPSFRRCPLTIGRAAIPAPAKLRRFYRTTPMPARNSQDDRPLSRAVSSWHSDPKRRPTAPSADPRNVLRREKGACRGEFSGRRTGSRCDGPPALESPFKIGFG
jgi:hypothetical protein